MDEEHVETGIVTAAVTLPAAPSIPSGWDIHKVAKLVNDVAMNLYDLPTTLKTHSLTPSQYATLEKTEVFKAAIEQATRDWHSPNSVQKRLALESALAVESALPTVAARLTKTNEPLSDVVALLKVLLEAAGAVGAKAATVPQGTGERFKIVINLGDKTPTTMIDVTPEKIDAQSVPS